MPCSARQFQYTEQNKKGIKFAPTIRHVCLNKGTRNGAVCYRQTGFRGQSVGQIMDRVAQGKYEIKY